MKYKVIRGEIPENVNCQIDCTVCYGDKQTYQNSSKLDFSPYGVVWVWIDPTEDESTVLCQLKQEKFKLINEAMRLPVCECK